MFTVNQLTHLTVFSFGGALHFIIHRLNHQNRAENRIDTPCSA